MPFRVLITDHAWPSLDIERGILGDLGAEIAVAETASEGELTTLARDADAILTNWAKVPAAALDAAEHCLVVARYGVGVDNIPVARATELGILVTNVPDFCTEEVSDHAVALVLACARRVVQLARATSAGSWNLDLARGLPRLRGQRLGLIGFGGIPHALIPKARGFGLDVLVYTPRLERGRDAATGVEMTNDLAHLLSASDYVSLHAPASPETHGLIGEDQLRRMKPTAYLINTSRGALVDEAALFRALTEGWIAGAALDVMAAEPPPADHPLLALPNVIVTPHVGFYSETSVAELATRAAQSVADALRGELPQHVVNPGVLELVSYRLGR
jgi:D-3-phosphoglycerate dehydrogenase / 2-oxoglutarate reductase